MGFVKDNKGLCIEARGKQSMRMGTHSPWGYRRQTTRRLAFHGIVETASCSVVRSLRIGAVSPSAPRRVGNLPEYITLFPHGVAHERTNCCTFIGSSERNATPMALKVLRPQSRHRPSFTRWAMAGLVGMVIGCCPRRSCRFSSVTISLGTSFWRYVSNMAHSRPLECRHR